MPQYDRTPLIPRTDRPFPAGAFDEGVVGGVAELLGSVWDPAGRIIARLRRARPGEPAAYTGYAQAVCGILAAGGNFAQISQYLRLEEEKMLGTARTSGRERWAVARGAAELMGKPLPEHPA